MIPATTIAGQAAPKMDGNNSAAPRRLILHSFQSPGDIVMLTAAVRDLHLAHPRRFQTDIRTSADALWQYNPHISRLNEHEPGVETIECHYPLIHQANSRPYHFIHGYAQFLEQRLGVTIPLTRFAGDIHLSTEERQRPLAYADLGLRDGFWIVIAGGKYDFTAKWWNPASYQAVIDHFQGRIQFAQCGEAGHWHPRLKGVVDLVGRTGLRDFVLLMHHASGVFCPVTFAMHLAAAVETRPGRPRRPCVVVAGARESAHWEQYPGHQFLHTLGSLPCCANDPCWRSRCQLVGDGDEKDRREVCERPVQVTPELRIAECMTLITPADVIRAIELYAGNREPCIGHSDKQVDNRSHHAPRDVFPLPSGEVWGEGGPRGVSPTTTLTPILIDFRHGLGDAVQLTTVLLHLRHYHPDWQIDIAAGIGKLPLVGHREQGTENSDGAASGNWSATAFHPSSLIPHRSLYHRLLVRDREPIDRAPYKQVFDLAWDECPTCYPDIPSTKAEYCLRSVFHLAPIPELCRYELAISDDATAKARTYLESICGPSGLWPDSNPKSKIENPKSAGRYPVVLLHYQGNTSGDQKDLLHDLARRVCEAVVEAGYVPVILDWDKRSPLPDGERIHNPGTDAPLWGASGTGDGETLAALIAQSSLFVGVDSGPLHVAGARIGHREQDTGAREGESGREGEGEQDTSGVPASYADNLQFSICNFQFSIPTPTIAVWTGHHPLHYFGLADHVTHLVPDDHASRLRGDRSAGMRFFEKHYRHRTYRQLDDALPALVLELLADDGDELMRSHDFWVRRDNVEQDLVIVRDIAEQDSYRLAELDVPGPVVVDVGAHIGVFSRAFKRRHPSARVVAVECCPENISALERNIGGFATIVPAALTYEGDVALLNAVYPGCVSTGGSMVVRRTQLGQSENSEFGDRNSDASIPTSGLRLPSPSLPYWLDARALPTITLEQLMADHQLGRIDVLKLDCEGSEFSILENTTSLASIGAIVGEYHGRERFMELVTRKFSGWRLRIVRDEDPGTFWLIRPHSAPAIEENHGLGSAPSATVDVVARQSVDTGEFWTRFLSIVHENDQPVPDGWRRYYQTLFELARRLQPRSVCEIGVRAGYSAFTILSSVPTASFIGIDADCPGETNGSHGGRGGLVAHAEKILVPFDFRLVVADSHALARLPRCDLVYIDGDHSFDGCLADLCLAAKSTDRILVDDYDLIPEVRLACERFAANNLDFRASYIANALTGFLLLERNAPGDRAVTMPTSAAKSFAATHAEPPAQPSVCHDDGQFQKSLRAEGTAESNRLGRLRASLVKKHCHTVLDMGIGCGTFIKQWAVAGGDRGSRRHSTGANQARPCGGAAQGRPRSVTRAALPNAFGYDENASAVAWLRERGLFVDPYVYLPPEIEALTFWRTLDRLRDARGLLGRMRLGMLAMISTAIADKTEAVAEGLPEMDAASQPLSNASLTAFMTDQGFDLIDRNDLESQSEGDLVRSYVFRKARAPALLPGWARRQMGDPLREIQPGKPLTLRALGGMGDLCWLMSVVGPLKQRLAIPRLTLHLQSAGERDASSRELARRFIAVDEVTSEPFDAHVQPAVVKHRLHYVPNGYAPGPSDAEEPCGPYTLLVNPWVEWEGRIEAFVPGLECDFSLFATGYRRDSAEIAVARSYSLPGYLCGAPTTGHLSIHLGSRRKNSTAGMNRGGLWSLDDWLALLMQLRSISDLPVYILGGKEDADFAHEVMCRAAARVPRLYSACGATSATLVIEVLRESSLMVSLASGLAVAACYLGVPTVAFFGSEGRSLSPDDELWFSDGFCTNWVPPSMLASGLYYPAIYGRDDPERVFAAIARMLAASRAQNDEVVRG